MLTIFVLLVGVSLLDTDVAEFARRPLPRVGAFEA